MKALTLARALSALIVSVLCASLAYAGSVLPLPSVNGPSIGDPTTNLYSIMQALQNNTTSNYTSFTTVSIAAGAATSTQMNYGFNFLTAASGATATVVLPPAKAGADISIANGTSQGLLIFGSTSTSTATIPGVGVVPAPGLGVGNNDYINGVVGTTGYSSNANLVAANGTPKLVQCIAPQAGNWWCASGN